MPRRITGGAFPIPENLIDITLILCYNTPKLKSKQISRK